MFAPTAAASCKAQRLLQKTSGPFNTDVADVTDPVASVSIAMTTDDNPGVGDLVDFFPKDGDSLLDLKDTFDLDLEDSNSFLENFTDLSSFLLDQNVDEVAMDTAPEALETVAIEDEVFTSLAATTTEVALETDVTPRRKRKAATTAESIEVPADHCGYTTKRARTSSSTTGSDMFSDTDNMPDTPKPDKYKERRRKNNIASRRSRETRKQKFVNMEQQAHDLEAANEELRNRVVELEQLAKEMKEVLVKRLAQTQ